MIVFWYLAAFSCSSTKDITVRNNKVNLQTEPNTLPKHTENEQVNTVGFASMVETPNHFNLKETENTPLFKAIPDSVLEYVPTIAEEQPSLEEEEVLANADPPTEPQRNPNFYARTSLTLGLIAFFTAASYWGPLICGTLAIVYAKRSRLAKEPNQKKARAGKFWGIASFFAIPLAYIAISILGLYL